MGYLCLVLSLGCSVALDKYSLDLSGSRLSYEVSVGRRDPGWGWGRLKRVLGEMRPQNGGRAGGVGRNDHLSCPWSFTAGKENTVSQPVAHTGMSPQEVRRICCQWWDWLPPSLCSAPFPSAPKTTSSITNPTTPPPRHPAADLHMTLGFEKHFSLGLSIPRCKAKGEKGCSSKT